MRTIEKKAYIWARNELFTLERAEAHIRRLNELKSGEEKIKRALGIKDRELSSTESRYVRSWIEMGFDVQTLLMAYDRTVLKTGKLSWAYMNSIVCSWHNQNIHSVEEIEKKEPRSAQSRAPQTEKQPVSLGGQELERLRQSVLRAQQNEKQ